MLTEVEQFYRRHIGINEQEELQMLKFLGFSSMKEFISKVIPNEISRKSPFKLNSLSESEAYSFLKKKFSAHKRLCSFIGKGFYQSKMPAVIERNILQNPSWYTAYTPYQAEISQGRLESLINFQTMVCELTGLEVANASLLDESTAAAEAMTMCWNLAHQKGKKTVNKFLLDENTHLQTKAVLQTRAEPLDLKVCNFCLSKPRFDDESFALLLQYPASDGNIWDFRKIITQAKEKNIFVIIAVDLLALCLLKSAGELGADAAIGNSGRFGLPMGMGGPHAGFISCKKELMRKLPGRIVGVSKDVAGRPAYRLTLQTREQHIRRDKATSNICTAQVLPAVLASMYAVYHGAAGLKKIAAKVHSLAFELAKIFAQNGYKIKNDNFFDTLKIQLKKGQNAYRLNRKAISKGYEFRVFGSDFIGISIDEQKNAAQLNEFLHEIFGFKQKIEENHKQQKINKDFLRTDEFLRQKVFKNFRTETELLRYIKRLERKDYSLADGMIPLGSCTMKLNPTTAMKSLSWQKLADIHPYTKAKTSGYEFLLKDLQKKLAELTELPIISLQPNAGSQGEFAGLLAIRKYLHSQKKNKRQICLIPESAHGTNPASAVMAGFKVIVLRCSEHGDISISDLKEKISQFGKEIAAIMLTYPSTHGVFEENIKEICQLVHQAGAQVYMDGEIGRAHV